MFPNTSSKCVDDPVASPEVTADQCCNFAFPSKSNSSSNHGYKMLGVGCLVAEELLGEKQELLEPFRFSRFKEGKLHPVSNSPYPWS